MEPIEAVYIKEENIPDDNEQEDIVFNAILEGSKDEHQEKKFGLCYEQNDSSVMGKPLYGQRVQSTLLVKSNVSSYSVSNQSSGSITSTSSTPKCICAICLQPFSTWDLLMKHVFTHVLNIKSPLHICHLCGRVFLNLSMMRAHNFHHSEKTIFKEPSFEPSCAVCAQTLRWCYLMKHVFSHISTISAPLYVCAYCCGSFGDISNLHFHKCTSRTSQRSCYCDKQQLSTGELQINRIEEEALSTYSCSNRIYEDCGKSTNYFTLRQHKMFYYSERPYTCDICRKSFKQSISLSRHQRIHSGERSFCCQICTKRFKHSKTLKIHQLIHFNERPFLCDICGKSFTDSGNLKSHQRIHFGKHSFSCDVCGKSFKQFGHLESHQRIHSGERLFSCNVCGGAFTESRSLKEHERIHSGERPFSCDVCGKSFTQHGNLKCHLRIHSGERPFCCNVCAKSFKYSRSLKIHQRTHFDERSFLCDLCGKSFTESGNLKIHQRIHSRKYSVSL